MSSGVPVAKLSGGSVLMLHLAFSRLLSSVCSELVSSVLLCLDGEWLGLLTADAVC